MARKKKRSAKQLANDRRLGRMAKARAKKKRPSKRRKKVAKRKNPHKKTAQRKSVAKPHLWLVFKCKGRSVYFLVLRSGKPGWSLTKGEAILFRSKESGKKTGRVVAKKRGMVGWNVGVAPYEMTAPQIANRCEGKI